MWILSFSSGSILSREKKRDKDRESGHIRALTTRVQAVIVNCGFIFQLNVISRSWLQMLSCLLLSCPLLHSTDHRRGKTTTAAKQQILQRKLHHVRSAINFFRLLSTINHSQLLHDGSISAALQSAGIRVLHFTSGLIEIYNDSYLSTKKRKRARPMLWRTISDLLLSLLYYINQQFHIPSHQHQNASHWKSIIQSEGRLLVLVKNKIYDTTNWYGAQNSW